MARTKTYRSLGVNVTIAVPDNPFPPGTNEFKIYEAGIDNCIYRGAKGLSLFRELFADAVEKECGVEPEVKVAVNSKGEPRKDDEGNEILVYVDDESIRVEKALSKSGRTIDSFQSVADKLCSQLACDPNQRERQPVGPKNPPKSVYATADALINAGQAVAVAASLETLLGHPVATDRESLARAIHEDQLNELRKIKSKWGAGT